MSRPFAFNGRKPVTNDGLLDAETGKALVKAGHLTT